MTDQDFHKRYKDEVLPCFCSGDYVAALPLFQALRPKAPDTKSQAMILSNMIQCHDALCDTDDKPPHEHRQTILCLLREYVGLLNDEDAANWSIPPAQKLFGLCHQTLFFELDEDAAATECAALYRNIPLRFQPAFLEGLLQAFEQEATDYNNEGHEHRALSMGHVYLSLTTPIAEAHRGSRVAIRSRMADLTLFSEQKQSQVPDRNGLFSTESEARELLLASLDEEPDHTFSQLLQQHIEQRGHFRMQIARFWHDIRNRIAPLRESAKRLRHMEELPQQAHDQAVQIEKHIDWIETALRVSGAGHGANEVFQPDAASFQMVDPLVLCEQILEEVGLTASLSSEGTPRQWELAPGYLRLAMTNLLNNSQEAYQRHDRPIPDPAVSVSIEYDRGVIRLRDWAGGVPAHIGDPFAPYASGKDNIHVGAGLGLVQARTAIVQQEGTLTLAPEQPDDGAAFVIQFHEF